MVKLFSKNSEIICGSGGFIDKLAFHVKLIYGKSKFDESINKTDNNILHDSVITEKK
jgi:hypothetical protein